MSAHIKTTFDVENHIKVPESGCWIWLGAWSRHDYGIVSLGKNKCKFAHRFSWELSRGPIPDGLLVCHKCDVPACVNPDHLFLGTHRDNQIDCTRKGRSRFPLKLTADDIPEIRSLLRKESQSAVAARFNVSQSNISKIASGLLWRDVA